MKTKSHKFTISVTFDKPCTKEHALKSVRDCVHGDFYPYQMEDGEPGEFKIRGFGRIKKS